ncbi:MAG: methyltransferase [Nanoarchaeota archaeon]|nr:methyltransferase [Nanoarchaeota archaeon]
MNKKQLAIILSKLTDYKIKKPSLEQYTTPSNIASSLLWNAFMNKDVEGRIVADAGCGNGVLGIAALILGAEKVFFIDVDEKALDVTEENCKTLGLKNYELVQSNIVDVSIKSDTLVMNPPFGVQTKGLDLLFLKQGVKLADNVYLIYKGDGLKIIRKEIPDYTVSVIEKTELTLNHQFSYHKKLKEKTNVILARIFK